MCVFALLYLLVLLQLFSDFMSVCLSVVAIIGLNLIDDLMTKGVHKSKHGTL